ncbi:hypothetical protein IAQ61_001036 [Plenodomus lingam]|uniref:uncharacterized protein n=1 Tax=Leptosphaeria maculans TaxID=5022 RepID=UPI0033247684|nr:hypothetical protein IAQ61_001036 [Plenodomus lingam]
MANGGPCRHDGQQKKVSSRVPGRLARDEADRREDGTAKADADKLGRLRSVVGKPSTPMPRVREAMPGVEGARGSFMGPGRRGREKEKRREKGPGTGCQG